MSHAKPIAPEPNRIIAAQLAKAKAIATRFLDLFRQPE